MDEDSINGVVVEKVEMADKELATFVESEDEKAIVNEEINGELIQALVYLSKDNKPVLSYAGVKEVARRLKNIEYGVNKVEIKPEYVLAYAYAHNIQDNIRAEIPNLQKTEVKLKNGATAVDEFAFQKAVSKAVRNAIKAVIPIESFQEMVKMFLNSKPGSGKQNGNFSGSSETPISESQLKVIEIYFKDAGLVSEDIHQLFSVNSASQISKRQFELFAEDCVAASGRTVKPDSFRDYDSAERTKILQMIRQKAGK